MKKFPEQILQTLDANANRAREGLRVCEDICRFILNAPQWCLRLKEYRHSIGTALQTVVSDADLLQNRDSASDPGRKSEYDIKRSDNDVRQVFIRNIHRAQEAVRVLEELSPLADHENNAAETFKKLRFSLYDTEKELSTLFETNVTDNEN